MALVRREIIEWMSGNWIEGVIRNSVHIQRDWKVRKVDRIGADIHAVGVRHCGEVKIHWIQLIGKYAA